MSGAISLRAIWHFNPRSPCGERLESNCDYAAVNIFQSALPLRGATEITSSPDSVSKYFNPRSPCGERRYSNNSIYRIQDFNPRSPCGERHQGRHAEARRKRISIRAPLAGSDHDGLHDRPSAGISIRAPLAGSDSRSASASARSHNFNPRSPCGERPLHFVASIYYQQSVVFSKTVTANSVDKLRKTTAKSAITRCEPHS